MLSKYIIHWSWYQSRCFPQPEAQSKPSSGGVYHLLGSVFFTGPHDKEHNRLLSFTFPLWNSLNTSDQFSIFSSFSKSICVSCASDLRECSYIIKRPAEDEMSDFDEVTNVPIHSSSDEEEGGEYALCFRGLGRGGGRKNTECDVWMLQTKRAFPGVPHGAPSSGPVGVPPQLGHAEQPGGPPQKSLRGRRSLLPQAPGSRQEDHARANDLGPRASGFSTGIEGKSSQ